MKYNVKDEKVVKALSILKGDYGFSLSEDGIKTNVEKFDDGVKLQYKDGIFTIFAQKPNQIFWALKHFSDLFSDALPSEEFIKTAKPRFDDLSYMMDCSRNAVYTVETIKTFVSQLAVAGYSSFMLYTEDTFKVDDYPYFGYLRTPYTEEDIKEVDEYAKAFGIELIPCIQTLGHFNSIVRYPAMEGLFDITDILMVGEEETYKFIESLISTCAKYFTSRNINIGMDEAYLLGRGKYLDKNGYKARFEIMKEHLNRVCAICKKYGFKPMMWSDMFFSLALNAQYTDSNLDASVAELVPPEIELIYWDYFNIKKSNYAKMIKKHRVFNNDISFAGGALKWHGLTPDNRFSFKTLEESFKACQEDGIKRYIVTGWGDNGAEASCFSTMPTVYYAGYANYLGYKKDGKFSEAFRTFSGMSLKDFMTIDLANRITENNDINERNAANKYLLFNDVLLGTIDTIIEKGQGELYAKHAKVLKRTVKRAGKWAYLFKTQEDLCNVLAIKAELGIQLRQAYQNGDKEELKNLAVKIKKLLKLVDTLYDSFLYQWTKEARPNGFDVQDIRFGALKQRLVAAVRKINDYLDGKTAEIGELGEELLCFMGKNKEFEKDFDQCEYRWRRLTSVNVNN